MQGQHGVAIHKDNLYVLGFWECTVAKFCLNDMSFVKKVGGRGRSNGQFNLVTLLYDMPKGPWESHTTAKVDLDLWALILSTGRGGTVCLDFNLQTNFKKG